MSATPSSLPVRDPGAAAPRPGPRPDLSLIFPVFDEAGNVARVLAQARALAPRLAASFEIVMVDDGSRDGSAEAIERARGGDPRVRLLRHPDNRGYGAALRSGLGAARGRLVFFSDADLQFDLAELCSLLAHADEFDIVAGYRAPRRDPWPRRVLASGWATLVRGVFGLRVRDIDCAFKLFRREVIDAIEIGSVGAFVNTEILLRAEHEGFRIHQVPVSHRRRRHGRQTGARPRVVLHALWELVRFARELRGGGPTARRPREVAARAPLEAAARRGTVADAR